MKVLVATSIYPPEIGGPATYVAKLETRLSQLYHITTVAYTQTSAASSGVRLIAVSKQQPLPIRLVKYFWALWRAAERADLIYAQNAMAAGWPAVLVGRLRAKPVVIKFVGDEAWERATQHRLTNKPLEEWLTRPEGNRRIQLMRLIQRFALRRATFVTTSSAYLREAIIRAYGLKPTRVMLNYNAAEKPPLVPLVRQPRSHQVLTTARLTAWKGVDDIIRAVASLAKKFPDLRLVIAGDGPEKPRLETLASDLAISEQVQFLGNVSRAETWQLCQTSQIYVLNSTYEGLPHTVLTSLAAGIPVVATAIPGTTEVIEHEQTGILVRSGNWAQLAQAIERLLTNPTLVKKITANGRQLLKTKFSWDTHLATLDKIFQAALAEPLD